MAGNTRGIPREWLDKLNGASPYGSVGRVASVHNGASDFANPNQVPDWLRRQYVGSTDEGGGQGAQRLQGAVRDRNGREVYQVGENNSDENVMDWSRVRYDPELGLVTDPQNIQQRGRGARQLAAIAAAVMGGMAFAGVGAGAAGAAEAGAAGAAAGGAEAGGLAGLGEAGGSFGMLAPGMEAQAVLESTLLNQGILPGTAEWAAAGGGAIPTGGGPSGGDLPAGTEAPNTYSPDADPTRWSPPGNGITPGGSPEGSPFDGATAEGSTSGNPLLNGRNAGNLARLGLGLATMGDSLGGGGRSGGGGGGGGGSGDASSIIEQMANANRVNQNTPLGSRAWSQDANGRWTVNDTMNPAEQANFEQVQGMNSGVTGMARQRLAALLAGGNQPRERADAPLAVRFGG